MAHARGVESTELATLTAQQSPLPPLLNTPSTPHYTPHLGQSTSFEQQQHHLHPELRSPSSGAFTPASMTTPTSALTPYPLSSTSAAHYASNNGIASDQRLPPPAAMLDHSSGERLGLNYVLEPKQSLPSVSSPPTAPEHYPPSPGMEKPMYARSTRVVPFPPGENLLDDLLIKFVEDQRKQIASGVPLRDVIGPDEPTFDGLHDPSAALPPDAHPISALLTSILAAFPAIQALSDRVAVHFLMFAILRWQICPCRPCYERMPWWLRPIKEQFDIPHPAWIDHLQWPFMRYTLLTGPVVKFEDFFAPFTTKVSVNWPYPEDQVLLRADRPDVPSKMNPVFETHMRNLHNWSVGSIFPKAFPHLVDDSVRIEG